MKFTAEQLEAAIDADAAVTDEDVEMSDLVSRVALPILAGAGIPAGEFPQLLSAFHMGLQAGIRLGAAQQLESAMN